MELLILAVPFLTTAIMFGVKWLANLAMFANGAVHKPWLRFVLVLLSLIGVVSSSLITGAEINPDSISNLVLIGVQALLSAGASHVFYLILKTFSRTA
jgi:hypothetical protein